jgi:hypothetical protein
MIKILLRVENDVNKLDNKGRTPLYVLGSSKSSLYKELVISVPAVQYFFFGADKVVFE